MEAREKFSSRLGFILISAGCAVGLGNVWRFPYITGKYGGAAFVLIYLLFLVILGMPIMVMEFAVGRASQKSAARSFHVLEPKGSKWHIAGWSAMAGNYLLMMFYTTIGGWMLCYVFKTASGEFINRSPQEVSSIFKDMLAQPLPMTGWMLVAVILSFGICSLRLQKGVERITKVMMGFLFVILIALCVRSVTLDGAMKGLSFYLVPDFGKMVENGLGEAIFAAMGQAFFTLSLGIGAMAIFGSYIKKERSLMGESINICALDTLIALMAGLIIFPACFAFDVNPGEGPGLVFVTLPNVFNQMFGGQIWGALFFIFMTFAALSTIVAVFENIISFAIDLWGWTRKKQYWSMEVSLSCCPCPVYWDLICGAALHRWGLAPLFKIWKILLFPITCCPWEAWPIYSFAPAVMGGDGITSSQKQMLERALNFLSGRGFTSPLFFPLSYCLSLLWDTGTNFMDKNIP